MMRISDTLRQGYSGMGPKKGLRYPKGKGPSYKGKGYRGPGGGSYDEEEVVVPRALAKKIQTVFKALDDLCEGLDDNIPGVESLKSNLYHVGKVIDSL